MTTTSAISLTFTISRGALGGPKKVAGTATEGDRTRRSPLREPHKPCLAYTCRSAHFDIRAGSRLHMRDAAGAAQRGTLRLTTRQIRSRREPQRTFLRERVDTRARA